MVLYSVGSTNSRVIAAEVAIVSQVLGAGGVTLINKTDIDFQSCNKKSSVNKSSMKDQTKNGTNLQKEKKSAIIFVKSTQEFLNMWKDHKTLHLQWGLVIQKKCIYLLGT